jgi:hypothetical protein
MTLQYRGNLSLCHWLTWLELAATRAKVEETGIAVEICLYSAQAPGIRGTSVCYTENVAVWKLWSPQGNTEGLC